ncbi:MAG: hypothetical protein A3J24_08525 [Deltaproteobacteria bacterium RIFCSPLOWO2_02_FULL_53_8]|nr:MAG: hypothetical protein A3J24_08525 [Deltaproteobacteria bacterium RIFCSPLOWO2_02_FULL_53_8]
MKASSTRTLLKVALLSLVAVFGVSISGTFSTVESAAAKKGESASGTKAEAATVDPSDSTSSIYLDTSGKLAGVGDPNKPASVAWKAGRGWHPAALGSSKLPRDRYGLIDWAKIVNDKMIKPRPSLDPAEEEMDPLDMDVLIEAKGDFVDDVIYPHKIHTYWLKCEVCHPQIFIPAQGQNNMTMVGIANGEWCGRCHSKVAFPLTDCRRCHSSPKKPSAKK